MQQAQDWILKQATSLPYPRFVARLGEWERLTDLDGAEPPNDRTHQDRNAQLTQNHFDQSWDLKGIFTALNGATMKEVFDAYIKAEFEADWEAAKNLHGDRVCVSDLERTDAQRRADALVQIFNDAADNRTRSGPARFVHNIVWSASAFEEMVRRSTSAIRKPFDLDDYRCDTIDGYSLDPNEAFACATNPAVSQIRRVLVDADSVVIDLGAKRFFTGDARTATQIPHQTCVWPGCWVPASACQIDHLKEHSRGGRTNPGNGAPTCGRHNRWKQKGYTVKRTHAPDGTPTISVTCPNNKPIAQPV